MTNRDQAVLGSIVDRLDAAIEEIEACEGLNFEEAKHLTEIVDNIERRRKKLKHEMLRKHM